MHILARLLTRFENHKPRAMRYCIGVALRFPQFAEEYLGYAVQLKTVNQ